jgi:hypothetical protein
LDAVGFAHGVRFFFARSGFCPVVKAYGADVDAYSVACADIPVYG